MASTTTFTPTKTAQTDLLAWQAVASAADVLGSAFDCSAVFAAAFSVKIGRQTTTAFTAGYPNVEIQVSPAASGDDQWVPLRSFQPVVGASISSTTGSASFAAGASSCTVTSATNIAANDLLYLGHTTTITLSELAVVKTVSSTTVTFNGPVAHNHDSGCVVSDQAEQWTFNADLSGYMRVRARANNNGSGQGIYVEVKMTTQTNLVGTTP